MINAKESVESAARLSRLDRTAEETGWFKIKRVSAEGYSWIVTRRCDLSARRTDTTRLLL